MPSSGCSPCRLYTRSCCKPSSPDSTSANSCSDTPITNRWLIDADMVLEEGAEVMLNSVTPTVIRATLKRCRHVYLIRTRQNEGGTQRYRHGTHRLLARRKPRSMFMGSVPERITICIGTDTP